MLTEYVAHLVRDMSCDCCIDVRSTAMYWLGASGASGDSGDVGWCRGILTTCFGACSLVNQLCLWCGIPTG